MHDPRMDKLADLLIDYSTDLKKGEVIYIEAFDIPPEMMEVLIRKVYSVGGVPLISLRSEKVLRAFLRGADRETMKLVGRIEMEKIKSAQAYIGMRGSHNITERSDVPSEKMDLFREYWNGPVHMNWRVPKTKWTVMRWPTPSMAQQAEMSTEAFEDFFFRTCTLDYSKMSRAMDPLVDIMKKTDLVRITSPGTDLEFSIKGIPVVKAEGKRNLPDGEVFTAPVRNSVNGTIRYNTKTIYESRVYENIHLDFKEGKIVRAHGSDQKQLNRILDTDEGARYVGEFAFGLNPYVTRPMLDTLFDEKISGSIHFTPGNSYDIAFNGNQSRVHWDIVLIQTKEWGGGEIYFDGELIRKDGWFVLDELKALNPENLA